MKAKINPNNPIMRLDMIVHQENKWILRYTFRNLPVFIETTEADALELRVRFGFEDEETLTVPFVGLVTRYRATPIIYLDNTPVDYRTC